MHALCTASGVLMGFSINHTCYDQANVSDAFARMFPVQTASGVTQLNSASVDAGGLVNYSTTYTSYINNDAPHTRNLTVQLSYCDQPLLDQFPVQSLLFYCAIFFAFCAGFRSGFRP